MAKHNAAHGGNMKDTNKSFNKLAIMVEKEMEREEGEKNKFNMLPRRGKGKRQQREMRQRLRE